MWQEKEESVSVDGQDVVVFPGAGSFGGELRPLVAGLGASAWLMRYPGRFGSGFGGSAGSYQELVDACAEQVLRRHPPRCALVGHSFGAYVAHSTAVALEKAGVELTGLVVIGAAAPSLLTIPEEATRDIEGTAGYLAAVDPGLQAAADEWREIVVETALRDLRLLRESIGAGCPRVSCPVLAARGHDDPLTSAESIAAWAEVTDGGCAAHVFPGGHSELLRSPELEGVLSDALRLG